YNWEIGGGCESERVQVVGEIDCLVGMDEVSSIEGFNIYPNPSNGLFTMNLNTKQAENFNLIVRDVQGKLIYEEGISVNGAYRKDIDLSGLAKGVYYLHIQNDVTSKVEKLIIQ
ncbi:MAG: T9SS type A sorting domain-containing protein, partial [Vicingaceae bacterium]